MEDNEVVFQEQVVSSPKTNVGKPPTRLQKQAPASLQVDRVARTSFGPSDAVIPLLSPLTVSPKPLEPEEYGFPTRADKDNGAAVMTMVVAGGWQHPALTGYMENSAFLNLFQSKCVLVNDVQ
ncbi:hypothetical protein SLEP1_g41506 [Rubroshorea leprosula]|uniref:Uncharacterized protein n=1 Tax=Rubroshorea leprosula TaxID=152421 RepID=A0AAV5L770_9ROSI|nr:hypothetical protein SLEP1_g41506 [Rubroshorea leprosula]